MEELSLSLYSSHKTSSLFAAGFADSGIFYNGLRYEVPYIQNKPTSNALTVPSLSLRTTYSAPQLTARSIRPFTLIITNYFLCTFSRFPSFFLCSPPTSNPTNINIHYHLSISYFMWGDFISLAWILFKTSISLSGTGDGVHSAPKKMYFSPHTHEYTQIPSCNTHIYICTHSNFTVHLSLKAPETHTCTHKHAHMHTNVLMIPTAADTLCSQAFHLCIFRINERENHTYTFSLSYTHTHIHTRTEVLVGQEYVYLCTHSFHSTSKSFCSYKSPRLDM